jgi:hypothetical protein
MLFAPWQAIDDGRVRYTRCGSRLTTVTAAGNLAHCPFAAGLTDYIWAIKDLLMAVVAPSAINAK